MNSIEVLKVSQIKKKLKYFKNSSDAFDWLEKIDKIESFKWLLSDIVFEKLGGVKPIGFELHHLEPVRNGNTKEILINPDNFCIVSKKGHKKLDKSILALKQKERLKKWLEKEINDSPWNYAIRIKTLKEVLEKLEEGVVDD